MHVLIVHCHPEPASFNGALTADAQNALQARGDSVERSDLYAEGFDPVERAAHFDTRADAARFAPLAEQRAGFEAGRLPADVAREIARLERADLVILQFPLWWHAQPAMLKGWFDRVFVYGGLYSSRMRYDAGVFRGKRAILSVTAGAPAPTFSRYGRSGDITTLLWPINRSLYYVGFDVLAPQVSYGVHPNAATAHLDAARAAWTQRLAGIDDDAPIPFAGWADWDEQGALRADRGHGWRL